MNTYIMWLSALYIIKSGSIKSYVTHNDGDEQILNFLIPGDILGLDGLDTQQYGSSAIALQTSAVCAVPLQQFRSILAELVPGWLIKLATDNLSKQGRNITLLNKKKAKARIAAFLIDMADNYKSLGCSDKSFELSMSRDDIGNYLGLASETVSRTLTQLQQEGSVKMERKNVTIINAPYLSEMAQHR
jgi:CRP/FNR family transcriptional regulator